VTHDTAGKGTALFCVQGIVGGEKKMKEKSWMKTASGWKSVAVPYRCRDCPYPSPGFICRGKDGSCMRTEVEKFNRRSRRKAENVNG